MASHATVQRTADSGYAAERPSIARQLKSGAYKPALARLLELAHILPASIEFLDDMATCYWNLGDYETSIKLAQMVANASENNPKAWGKLGAMSVSVGDVSTAEQAFEKTLKLDSKDA